MNLSLTLNLTPPSTAPGTQSITAETPEIASFQDFLALMGLSALAAPQMDDSEVAAMPDPALTPAEEATGNLLPPTLPPTLPLLPVVSAVPEAALASAAAPVSSLPLRVSPPTAQDTSTRSAGVPGAQPIPLADPLASPQTIPLAANGAPAPAAAMLQGEPVEDEPASVSKPTSPVQSGPLRIELQAVAPAIPATTLERTLATSQAVLAQVQAQVASAQTQVAPTLARPTARRPESAEQAMPTAALPLVEADLPPVATVQPVSVTQTATAVLADPATTPPANPANIAPASEPAAPRHDFTALVDKLTQARELAQPGQAQMTMRHADFGQVQVSFALAGDALKVAMSSPDQAFAPAVQAALAERPISTVADVARADATSQRNDTVTASTGSAATGPQADGQRQQSGQERAQQSPAPAAQVRQQAQSDDDAASKSPPREHGRFA